jgi:2-dehydro-3-deoxygalactonokinase
METSFLSCDWGTTSFRLRWVQTASRRVDAELHNDEGIAPLYERWRTEGEKQRMDRKTFLLHRLKQSIEELSSQAKISLEKVPLLISGMASSSIGIEELPYAPFPFSLDGKDAQVKKITTPKNFPWETWLISGLGDTHDVIRGEETQVIGAAALQRFPEKASCIFPGTHSKHLKIVRDRIEDSSTFMTGEVFQLLSEQGLLAKGLAGAEKGPPDAEGEKAFQEGVLLSGQGHLLQDLFQVRVNHLFGKYSASANRYYLSGLLIGSELKVLIEQKDNQIVLCGEGPLSMLYRKAIRLLDLEFRTQYFPEEMMRRAVVEGQLAIINSQKF